MNIKAGIIGGAGMTGGELLRVLLNHPHLKVTFVHSRSQAGNLISSVHNDLFGETSMTFTDTIGEADVYFLCLGHGESRKFLEENALSPTSLLIDLSQDFRLKEGVVEDRSTVMGGREFIYGLPELQKEAIQKASSIANPGCFATAIQLALLPAAKASLFKTDIHVSAITGSTGAGLKPMSTTGFSWRNNNISSYKVFNHQHLLEIGQSVRQLQDDFEQDINFIPYRGNFSRGILASVYFESDLEEKEIFKLYEEYYRDSAFTFVTSDAIDLKQVVNTNKCLLSVQKHGKNILVTSVIDNLLKGAVGQAVQNMNLMLGLEETTALKLKTIAF
ncbi:N-acetyl-gamma-glutamyl-phosphate reductase [Algivirga pacifica]|uniref:N-acetyl-gamma-glutamyl-phosphate reductase n=1 Tax=Algivirga pacifica TaxID=1162670 RepID=A0ABP9DDJ0_9BACT